MRKTFKKFAASVMALSFLTIGLTGISASAASENDYGQLTGSRSGSFVTVNLHNKTTTSRYAQVSAYSYTSTGAYIDHYGIEGVVGGYNSSDGGNIGFSNIRLKPGSYYKAYGYLYFNQTPYGTPVASLDLSL